MAPGVARTCHNSSTTSPLRLGPLDDGPEMFFQKKVQVRMPPSVASKLGHALLLASAVDRLPDGVTFSVDEQPPASLEPP